MSVQENEETDALVSEFTDRLKSEYAQLHREWTNIYKELRMKAVTSGLAVGLSAASTVVFGNIDWTTGAFLATSTGLFKEHFSGYLGSSKSINKLSQSPLYVFIALEEK